ncbi:folylpolyglutamate synthase/dihydrofolate synthase family protein [Nocardia sp. NRRL S-836]|uniref:bifunctional tetrahydrofolate synthase/dihydrofolate synthase n=1 Tax=Nocardia sp. NRRL S-836 TaxID=1519492 RepID=UPI0006AD97AB|nr:folylpolyglutamate synthase/dihydrofolate synthase family protein [Nocardia sp. NRRL S-836]KOV82703.1 dihydrofolate synthase [Nocardia sp. NRRL S-836]
MDTSLDEFLDVENELNQRWPETKLEPSLDRIKALAHVLGDPQTSYPVVQLTGTNGKTSTSRMVDALFTRIGLRTGRYTSPHLQLATERISLDNQPISPERYVEVFRDIEPYVAMVDTRSEIRMSKFEVLTGMAYAAFADAPVDVAVVEVGMGGTWDATSIADARIAVLTPISIDHTEYLGTRVEDIAAEKAGIIKPGSVAVVGEQSPEAMRVVLERVAEVDAMVARFGSEFGVVSRSVAVGGQLVTLQGLGGVYEDIFLPLHGEHQAANAALALAAVEAFFGAGADRQLDVEAIREGFASVISPGRLERVRSAPNVFVDAAHNPHGAAALAKALETEFGFRKLVAVVAVMSDKDAEGILSALEPVVSELVITTNSSPRAMDPDVLAGLAVGIFGEDRFEVRPRLVDAIDEAIHLTEDELSGGGVIVTGSVVTAGEARALFGKEPA